MIRQASDNPCRDVLQAYFDDLLDEEGTPEQAPAPEEPRPTITNTEAGRPYHAFELAGMRLLIPAELVIRVDTQPPVLTRENANNWLVGYCQTQAGRLAVIDPQLLLGLQKSIVTSDRPDGLVCLRERCYGILVPAAGSVINIDPADVTWRGRDGRRPWLGGTIVSSRSILLDVDGLDTMLDGTSVE